MGQVLEPGFHCDFILFVLILAWKIYTIGVGGFPKTCLHSVIEVLNRGLIETDKRLTGLTPKLTEDMYHLLFILSAHPEMGGAVRRYLRTNTDFIQNHCRLLPFVEEGDEDSNEVLYIKKVNQQAWFLKTVAVELKVLAARSMRSSLQKLVSQLLSDRLVPADNPVAQNTSLTRGNIDNSLFIRDSLTQTSLSMPFTTTHTRNILTTILCTLSFKQRYPPNVDFNFFDYTAVEQLIHSCEEETESGVTLCNVSKLYKVVMNEINSSQISSGAAQRQEIMKVIIPISWNLMEGLTLSAPRILESCIKIKINRNFYFHASLWCL